MGPSLVNQRYGFRASLMALHNISGAASLDPIWPRPELSCELWVPESFSRCLDVFYVEAATYGRHLWRPAAPEVTCGAPSDERSTYLWLTRMVLVPSRNNFYSIFVQGKHKQVQTTFIFHILWIFLQILWFVITGTHFRRRSIIFCKVPLKNITSPLSTKT